MSSMWTEALVRDLRDLWDEGHSTAEIGRRLGVTKNAVIGKSHRLELTARPSPLQPLGSGEKLKRKLERQQRVLSRALGKGKTIKVPAVKSPADREADEFAARIAEKLMGPRGGVVMPEPLPTPEPYLDPRVDPNPSPVAPEPVPVPDPVPASPVEPGEDVMPPETPELSVEDPKPIAAQWDSERGRQCEMLNGKLKPWVRCDGVIERVGESWCDECRKIVFQPSAPRTEEKVNAIVARWMKKVA